MSDDCCVIEEKGICPVCHMKGRTTGRDVPALHLKPEALAKTTGWGEVSVCLNPDCEVLYFDGGQWIPYADSRTRVGYKEKEAPHPLCYCWNHKGEQMLEQVKAGGKSQIVEDIKKEVKAGTCRCEVANPTGGCCLSTINEYLKRNRELVEAPVGFSSLSALKAEDGGISAGRLGLASMLTVSLCCGVPFLLAVLGIGGLGLGSLLGAAHLPLTIAGFLILGAGYFLYFREARACSAKGCAMPRRKSTLSVLIAATVFVTLFSLWSNGVFAKGGGNMTADALSFQITGMTCEGCASHVKSAIGGLSGVQKVEVSLKERLARVQADPPLKPGEVVQAVEKIGYGAKLLETVPKGD